MIRISVTADAFEAITATLPVGSVGFEAEPDDKGEIAIWLDEDVVGRITALRGPGESYSDVIMRFVALEAEKRP